MNLTLVHTSLVHVPVFDALRDADHPGLELRHVVREELLVRAGVEGPEAVTDEVRTLLAAAVADGADAVLCTCSTLGAVAEGLAADAGVLVLRVDRPMAARAVAEGEQIAVVATVRSTFGPTLDLVEEEAARAGRAVDVRTVFVEGAWDRFLAGDRDGYLALVAEAVDGITDADVVVLAQASLTDAAERARTTLPVLSSPRLGLDAAASECASGKTA
ncbi:aspartate/glutamate racemase family protein [Streptomyces endophyticus]|uniref:Aspartate/glutamate racemase family protein n=1 Tax=Streptomyces endophyticus TaxID=714166 RepID=A0ABU6F9Y5_9ACTN|nr:aspartate/glutamate racemase family protein [Streptomyces endophyticus]MEB8340288.1 aspartate/glutamate racemase family protein [Streptomyces endophyticus]